MRRVPRRPTGQDAEWEGIITPNEERALAAKLINHVGEKREARTYTLSGLVTCSLCGSKLLGSDGLYRCSPRSGGCGKVGVKVEPMDRYVLETVQSHVAQIPLVKAEVSPEDIERDTALGEVADIEARLDKLAADYTEGLLDARQVKVASDKLRTRRNELDEVIRGDSKPQPWLIGVPTWTAWDKWTPDERMSVRSLIRTVAHQITLAPGHGFKPDRVSITWDDSIRLQFNQVYP